MATIEELLSDPELLNSSWDLEPIVDGQGSAGVERLLDEALARGAKFAEAYTGKIASLDGAGLREAMLELAAILELVDRAGSYAMLRFTTDTADPARGALLQLVQERGTALETQLLFFELEWAALEDEQADALLEERSRPRVLRPPPAQRSSLPPAPPFGARGEGDGREGPDCERVLDQVVRGAGLGHPGQSGWRGSPA